MKYYFPVRHASENALEEYALGRLPEPELASLEEHLLLCDKCRERLRTVDELIEMLRVATGAAGARSKSASV
jgi:anti-sigma factor RsiW